MTKTPQPNATLELGEIAPASSASAVAPRPGDQVGPYVLEKEVGRGGMGSVFQAYDAKLDRRVAIKFVTSAHVSSVPRFVAEARVTARCTHPNIVVIHDISEHRGAPFMVLEQLHGQPVSQILKSGPMAFETVVDVMLQVARALHHAHKQGIVHRDLKPANIFVTEDDTTKVLDFGIAKLLSDPVQRADPDLRPPIAAGGYTAVDQLVGTFEYMAPEQMLQGEIDHRADIWAFGMTMFQMIEGKRPLEGATEMALLEQAQRPDEPMPSLALLHPELPLEVTALVDRCLAKRPEHRPQDAATLIRTLRGSRPAGSLPPPHGDPLSDPGRPSPSNGGARLPAGFDAEMTHERTHLSRSTRVRRSRVRRVGLVVGVVAVAAVIAALVLARGRHRSGDDERRAQAQVARLAAEVDRHLQGNDRAGAEALVQAFVDEPGHQRSGGAALAWQAWGQRLVTRGERPAALDAHAQAYLGARGDRTRTAALLAIAELDVAEKRWEQLGAVLAVIDGIPGGTAAATRVRAIHDLAQGVPGAATRAPARWQAAARVVASGWAGPSLVRRALPAQLDDDPAEELMLYDGATITAHEVGDSVAPSYTVDALDDLRCAVRVGDHVLAVGGRSGGHNVVLLDRTGREVASRPVNGWRCNTGDRDGDGIAELYVFGSGKLIELKLGPGADLDAATVSEWSLGSEIGGVVPVAHAGGRSLLVAVAEWRGYDLRLVDIADDGTLALRDREKLGLLGQPRLVRRRGRPPLYAALLQHVFPSRKALGAASPTGAPAGLYLFEVTGDGISVFGRIELIAGDSSNLVVADLDGDGGDELLVSSCPSERCTTAVILPGDDGAVDRFWMNGLEAVERMQADGDLADEVVALTDDRHLWVLGGGDQAVPSRAPAMAPPVRPPPGLDRATAGAWQRGEDLARIGLYGAAAASFRTLRSLATDGEIQDAALERAATLLAAGDEHAKAALAWDELAASRDGEPAVAARVRAAEARQATGQLAPGAGVALVEDGRPADAWRIHDPTGFYLDPTSGRLIVDSTTAGTVIAEVALERRAGPMAITFELTMTRAEWAGGVTIELVPRDGGRTGLIFGVRGGGGGQAVRRLAGVSGPSAFAEGAHLMPSVDAAVNARLSLSRVEGDRMRARWDIEGSPPWEQTVTLPVPPGTYDLRVFNDVPGEVASGVGQVHTLVMVGFDLVPGADPATGGALDAIAAALSRNDPRGALTLLDRAPSPSGWEAARMRAIALELIGRRDEARAVLRAALAAEGAARRPARIAELAWLRRVRDGQFAALAKAAAGEDVIALESLAWKATGYQHLYEPRVQERLADELGDLPAGTGAQVGARAQLHLLRGTALSVLRRTDEAHAELERAFTTGTDVETRQEAAIQLALDAASTGSADESRRWTEAALDIASDPLWIADQLLLAPAMRALAQRPDFARLRQHGRMVPADVPLISER